jgi:hypothetical protein
MQFAVVAPAISDGHALLLDDFPGERLDHLIRFTFDYYFVTV